MIDSNEIHSGERAELKLAREQALKYGKDLAQIYVAERARREELEIAYQALSAVFASTPDSLIVLNEEHLIQQANLAFSQLVEMPTDELNRSTDWSGASFLRTSAFIEPPHHRFARADANRDHDCRASQTFAGCQYCPTQCGRIEWLDHCAARSDAP